MKLIKIAPLLQLTWLFSFIKGYNLKKNICIKLRSLRREHGYSQQEVAERLHMSQNAYSEMETGKTKIDIEKIYMLAQFYKVPLYNILPEIIPAQSEINMIHLNENK